MRYYVFNRGNLGLELRLGLGLGLSYHMLHPLIFDRHVRYDTVSLFSLFCLFSLTLSLTLTDWVRVRVRVRYFLKLELISLDSEKLITPLTVSY
jgi:hypothetical protein